ncbi:MAG: hypothetical protein ACYC3F_03525 [Gemmatimonadaceae bacterium]
MTESARRALEGLRDPATMQWYAIPLLAIVFLIYAGEVQAARRSSQWNAVIAGASVFAADFVNETINGWIFALSGYSALWLAPGPTALRTMVGWNIEIMFMFAILGIVYHRSLADDPAERVGGLPNRWFWALCYSAICVVVELFLNRGGLLVWDYAWWNKGPLAVLPIFVFGYLWFFLAAKFAIERTTLRSRIAVPVVLAGIAVVLNVVGRALLGLQY